MIQMNIMIGFVSMSGNTEDIVQILQSELERKGCTVHIQELDQLYPSDFAQYDAVLLGSYTWGDGDLPYEAEDFVDELGESTLNGLAAAAFGSGDLDYPKYCAAVDTLEQTLASAGATIVVPGLKMEFDPNTPEKQAACRTFANDFFVRAQRLHA